MDRLVTRDHNGASWRGRAFWRAFENPGEVHAKCGARVNAHGL
jgi:hypothetical protein